MNKHRIAAILLISAATIAGDFALLFPPAQLEARNTTVITHMTQKPAVVCGIMSCSGNNPIKSGNPHGGAGGGGTIHLGS